MERELEIRKHQEKAAKEETRGWKRKYEDAVRELQEKRETEVMKRRIAELERQVSARNGQPSPSPCLTQKV